MTPTLVRQHLPHAGPAPRVDPCARARDWAEIQERMLVPLHEALYERLEVGTGTRLLGLGCGSGLALLMAASRGAAVTGVDSRSPERVTLARERLLPQTWGTRARADTRLVDGTPEDVADAGAPAFNLVTAFEPIGCVAGDSEGLVELLESATPLAERGAPVVLAGWGPPERCATSSVLRVAAKLADPLRRVGSWRAARRDDLEEVAQRAGLKPDGSGRVACPFGYADVDSAVRGLLSTGLFDAAVGATDEVQVDKELREALHPHQRRDGTVWMANVFRYLIARTG
ncbi:SAM-dependent methyltransferase [Streptomyces sp. NBC_00554]|uniref:SAM-dependent methyltransferase n=1 Tax=unclassified Streptomyces TaxID=2593676 RepID=UPI002252DE6E|nr:SAM-dependent methyltransferase [Streptomyces sp. NBC_00620]MCX4979390.1 SAM-dependent methyltransferase [Streptomyces sp. NBC_00620]WUC49154.1 SAM-dependent methyltransferase [Streptomyces sp. NBC_00554]